ncbi:MAG: hypothetical protein B6245_15105 [Desulfobacteraceae bacterium 4572_88]|nr:MAG: hypothetical protein B6245_15105 [Desulfobacteraceae bacterium 4572_88]
MIKVENLIYEYPGKRALDNVSFEIKKGSITALVGPNGAGKTTLLKCLAALFRPFSGKVSINGTDVSEKPKDCHRQVGFLHDFFGLYDALTVEQTLTYFAMAQKMEKKAISLRIQEIVGKLNLQDKVREPVGNLSRGMRQRLAIAQAMIHDPEVLLLDEPASGLDPNERDSLSKLFLELNRAGKTLLVSSHILSELDQYANDILILREGRMSDKKIYREESEKKQIRIRVSDMPENIDELLENTGYAQEVSIEDGEICLAFGGNEQEQRDFLKTLIQSDIPVTEFYVRKKGIQEHYLEMAE